MVCRMAIHAHPGERSVGRHNRAGNCDSYCQCYRPFGTSVRTEQPQTHQSICTYRTAFQARGLVSSVRVVTSVRTDHAPALPRLCTYRTTWQSQYQCPLARQLALHSGHRYFRHSPSPVSAPTDSSAHTQQDPDSKAEPRHERGSVHLGYLKLEIEDDLRPANKKPR